jgi:diguanylate cyclase (GGDEF)-like protein
MSADRAEARVAGSDFAPAALLRAEVERLKRELEQARARIAELEQHADVDPLLDILNRRGFERELKRSLAYVKRYGTPAALLYVDLDGFKAINDRYGHAAGDRALREVAERLEGVVRERDLVARVGGDEFVVMLPDLAGSPDAAEALRDRVGAALRRPFELRDGVVALSATIGLARFPDQATTPRGLLDVADREMYERKGTRGR